MSPLQPPARYRSRWSLFLPLWSMIVSLVALAGHSGAAEAPAYADSLRRALDASGAAHGGAAASVQLADTASLQGEYHRARRLYRDAARLGHTAAQVRLALMFDRGEGGERNARKAARWYRAAASQGHPLAQHNLGVAYAHGEGVALDIERAMYWWRHAASAGNAGSAYNLGLIHALGIHGVARDLDEAAHWWQLAAVKGDPRAQYRLGALYARTEEPPAAGDERCRARYWWTKSAANGNRPAALALQLYADTDIFARCPPPG